MDCTVFRGRRFINAVSLPFSSCKRTDSSARLCWCNTSPSIRNSLFLFDSPSLHLFTCAAEPLPWMPPPPHTHTPSSLLPPPSWDSKGCYLTRSMTLSRGASLTVSSLMAKIWSPGRSLPKEGPSADERQNCTRTAERIWKSEWLWILLKVPAPSLSLSHTCMHTNQQRRSVQWQASGCLQRSQSLELGGAGWWPVERRQDLGYHCPYHPGSPLTLQCCGEHKDS